MEFIMPPGTSLFVLFIVLQLLSLLLVLMQEIVCFSWIVVILPNFLIFLFFSVYYLLSKIYCWDRCWVIISQVVWFPFCSCSISFFSLVWCCDAIPNGWASSSFFPSFVDCFCADTEWMNFFLFLFSFFYWLSFIQIVKFVFLWQTIYPCNMGAFFSLFFFWTFKQLRFLLYRCIYIALFTNYGTITSSKNNDSMLKSLVGLNRTYVLFFSNSTQSLRKVREYSIQGISRNIVFVFCYFNNWWLKIIKSQTTPNALW